jgi:AraC family transcriptional regulator of adaptative response / DNA-3-methyladenine glycosylase II
VYAQYAPVSASRFGVGTREAGARARTPSADTVAQDTEIVRLGIQFILDGALDDDDGEALAARLGVSHRRLRHLFQTIAGITPDRLARSSRSHFARRMLENTDLPVTDIAFASGFGSLRQFNRAIAATFGATPMALRARQRRGDSLMSTGGLVVRLGSSPEPVWAAMLAHLRTHAIPGVENVHRETYRRIVVIDGDVGAFEVRRSRTGELLMQAHLLGWRNLLHVIQTARRLFNLDVDAETANRGPGLGMRIPGTWEPLEVAIRALIGQDRPGVEAGAIAAHLVERNGQSVPGFTHWELTHAFPPAPVIASAELDDIGLTMSEVSTVRTLAESVVNGNLRLDPHVPIDDFTKSLLSIPGVDATTADYVALRIGVTVPDRWVAQGGLRHFLGQRRSQTIGLVNNDTKSLQRKSPIPTSVS